MSIKFQNNEDVLLVRLDGEIDHHSADSLKARISTQYSRALTKNLELDFSGVTFMDSSGVGMIIGRYKEVSERGGLLCCSGLNDDIARLFELSGLHKIIRIK